MTETLPMRLFEVHVSLDAFRMVNALPERLFIVRVGARTEEEAELTARGMASAHFALIFHDQPILTKYKETGVIKEIPLRENGH